MPGICGDGRARFGGSLTPAQLNLKRGVQVFAHGVGRLQRAGSISEKERVTCFRSPVHLAEAGVGVDAGTALRVGTSGYPIFHARELGDACT